MDADKLRELADRFAQDYKKNGDFMDSAAWFESAIEAGYEAGRLGATPAVVKGTARDAFIREAAMRIMASSRDPYEFRPEDRARWAVQDAAALADALGL